jgi:hypothetical protein
MLEFAEFVTVPVAIEARRAFSDSYQLIGGVNKLVPAGMWILRAKNGTGNQMMVPDDVFREGYRPTDTQSETAWNEATKKVYPIWPDGKPILLS